jgi:hypothetical protein
MISSHQMMVAGRSKILCEKEQHAFYVLIFVDISCHPPTLDLLSAFLLCEWRGDDICCFERAPRSLT